MDKKYKKILTIFAIVVLFMVIRMNKCQATGDLYLNNLNFDVQVNSDGSMDVTEMWNINIEDTNTLYKTFKKDSNKYTSITNVEVAEVINGTEKSFEKINNLMYHVTKDCYYGLTNDSDDFEIAWGVGLDNSQAVKTYLISYRVNDAVAIYSDYAEIYWQFVGKDFEIDSNKVTGTIILPGFINSKDEIKVWGHTEDLNGNIYATDNNEIQFDIWQFRSGRYIEVRTLFPKDTVYTSGRTYSKDILQEVLAEETKWANQANMKRKGKGIFTLVMLGIIAIISYFMLRSAIKDFKKAKKRTKITPTVNIKYFREIPRKGATPAQALFIHENKVNDFYGSEIGRIFSATLLDLCLKKYIEFEIDSNNKNNFKIKILRREYENMQGSENAVFQYLLNSSENKDYVTKKELENYIKNNPKKLEQLKSMIETSTKEELIEKKLLDEEESKEKKEVSNFFTFMLIVICFAPIMIGMASIYIGFINIKIFIAVIVFFVVSYITKCASLYVYSKKINVYTLNGVNEQMMWKGLEKYMEEFSLLKEKEIPSLVIWEQFLVYATVFGISYKVLKQLKVVFKDVDLDNYYYMNLMMYTDFSYSFIDSIDSSMSSQYSSGSGSGGGFSGGGGGGRWPEVVEEADNLLYNL